MCYFLKWTNSTILLQYTNAIGNGVKTLAVGWRLPYASPSGSYWIRPDLAGIIVGLIVSGPKAVGEAFTVKYRPCGSVKGTVGDYKTESVLHVLSDPVRNMWKLMEKVVGAETQEFVAPAP